MMMIFFFLFLKHSEEETGKIDCRHGIDSGERGERETGWAIDGIGLLVVVRLTNYKQITESSDINANNNKAETVFHQAVVRFVVDFNV